MPFAIWEIGTGKIKQVLGHEPSFDKEKRDALAVSGRAIKEVPNGTDSSNSSIDPATGEIIPLVTVAGDYTIYEYDTVTGIVGGGTLSTLEHILAPDAVPGKIVSAKPLQLFPRWVLTLDDKGMPTFDAEGNIIAAPPAPDLTPNIFHLLLSAAVNAGTLDPALIPTPLLDDMNVRMATVGAAEISVPVKSAPPIT